MGAEPLLQTANDSEAAPLILGLQPAALIDHVSRVDSSLLDRIPGDRGGSMPVGMEELENILREVKSYILSSPDDLAPVKTIAGGSVANTIRGLSAGFGVSCGIIGAYGDDEQGKLFVSNMSSNGVNLSRLRMIKGPTAQCVCLVDALGNRTMRPSLSSAVKVQGSELTRDDFKGSKWLVMRYSIFNMEIIEAAVKMAKQEKVFVSLDLASFEVHIPRQVQFYHLCDVILVLEKSLLYRLKRNENKVAHVSIFGQMVRDFRLPLLQLLESGDVDLCFANEDEAKELIGGEKDADPEVAVEFLAKHCQWAVVTLGANGCIAKHGKEIVRVPAIGESKATDATGAGDLFASGFLYGLVKGLSLEKCCQLGSCSGGSVIRALGGEVTPENWQWMHKHLQIKGLPLPEIPQ